MTEILKDDGIITVLQSSFDDANVYRIERKDIQEFAINLQVAKQAVDAMKMTLSACEDWATDGDNISWSKAHKKRLQQELPVMLAIERALSLIGNDPYSN